MFLFLTTAWFWISVALVIGLFIVEAAEAPALSGVALLAIGSFAYYLFADINLFRWAVNNPAALLGWAAVYLVVGTVWGIVKWYLYLLNKRDEFRNLKKQFMESKKLLENYIPLSYKEPWDKWLGYDKEKEYPPQARRNKSRITRWMAYWPVSVLWTLVDDFVRRVYTAIYNAIHNFLQSISDRVFSNEKIDWTK